jgi:hypothetical protein
VIVKVVEEEHVEFSVQAYDDDVVVISQEPQGIEEMMRTSEEFVEWSRMEINAAKCTTASYIIDDERHRSSWNKCMEFQGQETPNFTLSQSLKYLGTAVTAKRTVNLESVKSKVE